MSRPRLKPKQAKADPRQQALKVLETFLDPVLAKAWNDWAFDDLWKSDTPEMSFRRRLKQMAKGINNA